jgi:GNAT superfamily N-acetyltransferase
MTPPFCIAPVTGLHPGMEVLRIAATGEGFHFLDRLVAEWHSGTNMFNQPGELLVGAFRADSLFAVCGLNRDPFADRDEIGRLRHLYVRPSERRCGVGSALVGHLLGRAEALFRVVRLRTAAPEAAALYVRHGFVPVADESASHAKVLRQS